MRRENRTVVVFAGSRNEFLTFCQNRRIDSRKAVYATSLRDLDGLNRVQVYKTGSWYLQDRNKLSEMIEWLKDLPDVLGVSPDEHY